MQAVFFLSRTIDAAPKQSASTRDRLIDSARFLFWERGFAGTSMAELLAHAQVNSGSFYHFFDSKEALLRAVLEQYAELLRPMVVDPAFAATPKPLERIFAILAGYRERILSTACQYGCPLGRLALEIDPENAPAHKLIALNFQGWIEAVRECLADMKSSHAARHRRRRAGHIHSRNHGRRSDAVALLPLRRTIRSRGRAVA